VTVDVQISNAIDDIERKFFLPVCGENTYRTFFHPIATRCELDLCDNWGTFNEVDKADFDRFVAQIDVLLSELPSESEFDINFKRSFADKFDWIIEKMKLVADRRDDIVFVIG
jgi:hypothetical protein